MVMLAVVCICCMDLIIDTTNFYMITYAKLTIGELGISKVEIIALLICMVIIAVYQALAKLITKLEKIRPIFSGLEIITNVVLILFSINIVTTSNLTILVYVTTQLSENFIGFCSDYYTTTVDNAVMRPLLTVVYLIILLSSTYITLRSLVEHTKKAFNLSIESLKPMKILLHAALVMMFLPSILGIVSGTRLIDLFQTIYGTIILIALAVLIIWLIYKNYKKYLETISKPSDKDEDVTILNYIEKYKNITLQWCMISITLVFVTIIAFVVDSI
jgi:hypothetical protein